MVCVSVDECDIFRSDNIENNATQCGKANTHTFSDQIKRCIKIDFYRPRSEASDGYVFTGICLSNKWLGGGWTTPKISHLPPPARVRGQPPPTPP